MRQITLLPQTTIGAAVTGAVSQVIDLPKNVFNVATQSNFLYGADGATVKVWLQTSLDDGLTWIDLISHAFTTAAARKLSAINIFNAMATQAITASDGALTDDTVVKSVIGSKIRVKYTTGVTAYTGATSIRVDVVLAKVR